MKHSQKLGIFHAAAILAATAVAARMAVASQDDETRHGRGSKAALVPAWAIPVVAGSTHLLPLLSEFAGFSRKAGAGGDTERLRRMWTLGSTGYGLAASVITRTPAVATSQAMTLAQSAAAISKSLSDRRNAGLVTGMLPALVWIGYAAGSALRRR